MKDKIEVRKALKEEHDSYDSDCGTAIQYDGKSVDEIKAEQGKRKEGCDKLFKDMNEHETKINGLMNELRDLCNDVRKRYYKAIIAMSNELLEKEILGEVTAEKDAMKLVEDKDIKREKKDEPAPEPEINGKAGRQYDVEDPYAKL
jgi:hypothetical protein